MADDVIRLAQMRGLDRPRRQRRNSLYENTSKNHFTTENTENTEKIQRAREKV